LTQHASQESEALMNIGEQSWPSSAAAAWRVRRMQRKLHYWAVSDPGRRFDDVFVRHEAPV
jgi:RNA-directed DNA polymerase